MYLDWKLPTNWVSLGQEQRKNYFRSDDETYAPGTIVRDRVCVAEILNECPNLGVGAVADRRACFRISRIMDSFPEWKKVKKAVRFGEYGVQKGWVRSNESVTEVTIF